MLGLVVTHSEIAPTPFSNWLEASGAHFDYASLEDGAEVNPGRHFYTANVSVKRVFLEQNRSRFDERFSDPAWKDIDFGSRLARQGLRALLNRAAVGEHLHGMSVAPVDQADDDGGRLVVVFRASTPRRGCDPRGCAGSVVRCRVRPFLLVGPGRGAPGGRSAWRSEARRVRRSPRPAAHLSPVS